MSTIDQHDFDLIVIGSGMGGLTVASLASQLLRWRVLVLERHWTLGGFTHAFERQRWRWDVGLHYVGGLGPGSDSRALFDLVTGGLAWSPLPQRFDVLHLPSDTLALDWREEAQAQALIERFPREAAGIHTYFADLARLRRKLGPALFAASAPPWVAWPLAMWSHGARRLAALSTQSYLDARFADPALKLALACRWGDYGLAPPESAFGIHAMVLGSYADGAGRPVGGAQAIAKAVAAIVRNAGGELRTSAEVEAIEVRSGRVAGVRVRDGVGSTQVVHAPRVVSAAGAFTTFRRLLDPTVVPADLLAHLDALRPRSSAAVLYLGLKENPERLGLRGENHWIVTPEAWQRSAATPDDVASEHSPLIFVSTAAHQDETGSHGQPTAQLMVPMQMTDFDRWGRTEWMRRGAEYSAYKQLMAEGLLAQVDARLPGLAALVEYEELSTPLTVASMTGHPQGAIYGLAASPLRMQRPLGARTPVRGLFLAGADVCTPGVQGAMMGGVFAVAALLGTTGMPTVMRAARRRAAETGS